jgi:hypothetical protein
MEKVVKVEAGVGPPGAADGRWVWAGAKVQLFYWPDERRSTQPQASEVMDDRVMRLIQSGLVRSPICAVSSQIVCFCLEKRTEDGKRMK